MRLLSDSGNAGVSVWLFRLTYARGNRNTVEVCGGSSPFLTTATHEVKIDARHPLPDALEKVNFIFKATFRFRTTAGN